MNKIYFTGDHHFFGDKIIDYTNRPFDNADQMTECLIEHHNETVSDNDIVHFLGDLAFPEPDNIEKLGEIIERMNGKKYLTVGNHDTFSPGQYKGIGFESVEKIRDLSHLTHDPFGLKLCHDPAMSITDRSSVWLCAHVHTLFFVVKNVVNVGVDQWDYKPVSLEKINGLTMTGLRIPYVKDNRNVDE